jgi:hypothetical protein
MSIVSSKSGVTKVAVISLVVIIVVGSITATYIVLQQPTSTLTSTQSSKLYGHTVNWTTMENHQTDFWNITATNPYTVRLNDTMTVSSGNQFLEIDGVPVGGQGVEGGWAPMWTVYFVNNTSFDFFIHDANGSMVNSGYDLPCSGIVQVVVTTTQITFIGISPVTSNIPFKNLVQIVTVNEGGNFNNGQLGITLKS